MQVEGKTLLADEKVRLPAQSIQPIQAKYPMQDETVETPLNPIQDNNSTIVTSSSPIQDDDSNSLTSPIQDRMLELKYHNQLTLIEEHNKNDLLSKADKDTVEMYSTVGPKVDTVTHLEDGIETPDQNDRIPKHGVLSDMNVGQCHFTTGSTVAVYMGPLWVLALIDTGAEINLASQGLVEALPPECYEKVPFDATFCHGVGGRVWIKDKLKLKIRIASIALEVVVHVLDKLVHPLILGTPFLMENKVQSDWGTRTLKFPKTIHLYNAHPISIKPYSQVFMASTHGSQILPLGTICMTEITPLPEFNCVISRALQQVGQDGQLPVALLNVSETESFIPEGQFLTTAEALVSVPMIRRWDEKQDIHVFTISVMRDLKEQAVQLADCEIVEEFPEVSEDILHLPAKKVETDLFENDEELGILPPEAPKPKSKIKVKVWNDGINSPVLPIIDDPKLTKVQTTILQQVIDKHPNAFCNAAGDPGRTTYLEAQLRLIPGTIPQHVPFRYTNPKYEAQIADAVNRMRKAGIVEENNDTLSEQSWTSRIVAVPRKEGTPEDPMLRICIDFRALNKNLLPYYDVVPNVMDTLNLVQSKRPSWYSALDVRQGFYSIPLDAASKNITAFFHGTSRLVHNVLPMGARPSPFFFQKLMNIILGNTLNKYTCCYIDDIIIFSSTFREHVEHLDDVLDRLEKGGLKLKAKKCKFAKRKLRYLGHLLGDNCVMPDPDRIEQVRAYPTPKNLDEVRSFLGFVGFYRRFIPKFAHMASPLHALTKADAPWEWTDKHQNAFQKIERFIEQNYSVRSC